MSGVYRIRIRTGKEGLPDEIFPFLSVYENLMMGAFLRHESRDRAT